LRHHLSFIVGLSHGFTCGFTCCPGCHLTSYISACYSGNIIGVDPLLGPLASNGGSTLTMLPLPGSPAINAGTNAGCPAYDQRGVKRPQGGTCDIGSVESLIWPRVRLLQVMH
jgi:hypothetical protein